MITSVLKKGFISAGVEQVKPAYLGVLMSLWRHEDLKDKSSQINSRTEIKTNELAQMAGLEPSTMTGLLDRMERDALIIRKNSGDTILNYSQVRFAIVLFNYGENRSCSCTGVPPPHNTTRQQTFFREEDYREYIVLMSEWCKRCHVEI